MEELAFELGFEGWKGAKKVLMYHLERVTQPFQHCF